ncbi:hypothetical protein ACFWNN_18975 [Lentzea sp. NPDC058450]|uniref:hypothetical protein n=1 Tax=Lentzea sp. NPDC058450 TaxID=3346505 RepID=UPI00365BB95F
MKRKGTCVGFVGNSTDVATVGAQAAAVIHIGSSGEPGSRDDTAMSPPIRALAARA